MSAAPDLEHVVRLPRPGGRKLFLSHRIPAGSAPAECPRRARLLFAGALFGAVPAAGMRRGAPSL